MNHVYFTALIDGAGLAAEIAAELAGGAPRPRVYAVEPTGAFENDPNVTDKKFPGYPTRFYRSNAPLRIVDEITEWTRLTPEELQLWRERLSVRLSSEGGEIINGGGSAAGTAGSPSASAAGGACKRTGQRPDDVDHQHMPSEPAITFIRPEQLTAKAPYAYAAVTGSGQLVFTAGACPLDADGNTVAVGDVAGQAHQVMANLVTALRAAGAQLTDVVKTTIYVASSEQADLGTAWHIVRAAFGEHDPPGTLLGVSVLGHVDQLVEVEAVAVRPLPPPNS